MPDLDAEKTLREVLRSAGFEVTFEMPRYPRDKVPFLFFESLAGSRIPGALEIGRYDMSSFETSRKKARDQWTAAADALHAAWLASRINYADARGLPVFPPTGVDGLHRCTSRVEIHVRA